MRTPILFVLALGASAVSLANPASAAPVNNANLDIQQGFTFSATKQTPVGFITALTIGNINLTADLAVKSPMAGNAAMKVVAVLGSESWAGGVGDSLKFNIQVSLANKQQLGALNAGGLNPTAAIQVTFVIYTYDAVAKKYFSSMSGTALTGTPDGGLTISTTPEAIVPAPANFAVAIGIKPSAKTQTINDATTSTTSMTKPWGAP